MVLLREVLGEALRQARLDQRLTLREVSATAGVSLGYLSEVERGQKEASSELLASICDALETDLQGLLTGMRTGAESGSERFRRGATAATQALRAASSEDAN